MKKRLCITAILVVLFVLTGAEFYRTLMNRQGLVYAEALSEVAVTVDQEEMTLYDMAFYVAYQEKEVQKDAVIYNDEKPHKYWNAHTNGEFVRVVAEQAVVDMAVHDELFYRMACEEGIQLGEEEMLYLSNEVYDFCSDLTDEQYANLGITAEDIETAMTKIALANKYQSILSQMEDVDYEDYDYTGAVYELMLSEHDIEVDESVWDRIAVGNITVNY